MTYEFIIQYNFTSNFFYNMLLNHTIFDYEIKLNDEDNY